MKKRLIPTMLVSTLLLAGCASDAADNHQQGLQLYNEGKYEQANQYLLAAVAENNAKGAYYIDLGMNELKLADYASAKDAFDHAVSLKDHLEEAYRGLGILSMERELYNDAVAYFDQAIDQVGLDVGALEYDILQYKADAQVHAEKYEDALKTYDALIQLGVNVPQNYLAEGAVYLKMGDEEQATACYDRVLEAYGQEVSTYFGIYNAFQENGYEEAGRDFLNKALEVEGDSALDHLNRGKIYYLMGDYSAAITELSYPLEENNAQAALYTAFCLEDQGDYESASQMYVRSLNIENNPVTANYYAMCLSANNDDNHAWNVVHTTMEKYPDCDCIQDLKWNEIILYERMNMLPSALTRLLEYQEAYPDDPNIEAEMQYLTLKQNNIGD
jgi:tetratricopeptide (TPR) repeat protein